MLHLSVVVAVLCYWSSCRKRTGPVSQLKPDVTKESTKIDQMNQSCHQQIYYYYYQL